MRFLTVVTLLAFLNTGYLPAQNGQTATQTVRDLDSDGLDDSLEQQLLEKFRPEFMLSESECDVAPAEFAADSPVPIPKDRNRTIYGQVFPHASDPRTVEIHYYHLWSRDCARMGHKLDAEYVAALVRADDANTVSGYKAIHWYAAAHEDTLCDGSTGATASSLGSETHGPMVWISSGKHASFFSKECKGACGDDRCENASSMVAGPLINIGEPGKPLNGAAWTSSPSWPLSSKMQPVFTESVLAQLDTSDGIIPLNNSSRAKKGVIRRSAMTADALQTGQGHTADAIATGSEKTTGAVSDSYSNTKSSLRRAAGAVGRWFSGKKNKTAE